MCRAVFLSLLCLLVHLNLSAQEVKVTLDFKGVPMEQVMNEIERQTSYLFAVNEDVDLNRLVTVKTVGEPLRVALDQMVAGTPVKYEVNGSTIFLTRKNASRTLSGTVVDENGEVLPGVSILVKGTTNGTMTDLDGNFRIEVPADQLAGELEFNCIGYEIKSMPIGSRSNFDVTLPLKSEILDQSVVTALGIRRSEKALSYNVQQIDAEAISSNKDANFINALNGKVAGLNINASSSGVGGATKVVMRGPKSISGSSNALYVIDGVPMYTKAREGSTEFGSQGSTDPIADINPEDIESLSVLTGAAAAALYGSDAANGAIVITTKKGMAGKTVVTATAGVEVMSPFVMPKFQNRYGTGDLNSSIGSNIRSWGEKLNSANSHYYDPVKDYFQTGILNTESVSLSTGTEKNQTYLSGSATDSRGIVPNNAYHRYNFTFRNTTAFFKDRMHLDVGASYILQKDRNTTNQGTYNNPLVGAYLYPRGEAWEPVKLFERYDPVRKLCTQYWPIGDAGITMQNPYWINYRNLRENRKDRFMFNASLSYDILDWLNVTGQIRMDQSITKYTEKFYASSYAQLTELSENGLYGLQQMHDRQVYGHVMVNINKRFGDDWTFQANVGASISDMYYDSALNRGPIADGEISSDKPGLPNTFNIQNLINSTQTTRLQEGWREQTQSVFGSAEVGFMNTWFLTVTARNDWPSQLAGPHSNRKSFFYPSVGLSVIVSELIPQMPDGLEYLKVNASFASVGTPFERYIANPMYQWNSSNLGWNVQTQYPMYDLKPELTNSVEVGLTARFLKDFSFTATYYHTNTLNQTFNPQISTGSGSSSIYIQSGDVRNQGVEMSLGFDHTWDFFTWSSTYTMSYNHNKIKSLAENVLNAVTGERFSVDQLDMGGIGQAHFVLREGGTLGDLYSLRDFKYDENGNVVVNADGTIAAVNIQDSDKYVKLGSVLPKSNMSWRNDFKIGNFNIGFLITARIGGVVYSSTQAFLDYYGVSEATAAARDAGGVIINGGDVVDANRYYTSVGGSNPIPTAYTYSATNVRLQEASIGYTFKREMLGGVCDLTLSLVGRNLWMIYNKAPFDPESVATTGNYYQGIDHFMMPSLRNVGFNMRIVF